MELATAIDQHWPRRRSRRLPPPTAAVCSLLSCACSEECDVLAASIYVNPTQFSKNEDFGVYPRSEVRGC